MARQCRLVLLLLLSIGVFQAVITTTPHIKIVDDINESDLGSVEEPESEVIHETVKSINKPTGVRISTPKIKEIPLSDATTEKTKKEKLATKAPNKPVSDEILNDLIEASKHSVALADDPRFNKMLPEKFKKSENSTTATNNSSDENYDDDYVYDYNDEYNYEEATNEPETDKKVSDKKHMHENKIEMKPIKEEQKKTTNKQKTATKDNHEKFYEYATNEDYNYNDDDDDDDLNDDDGEKEEVVYSNNVPCPRYCVCARNINSYLVATCSRFDPGTQKFGSDITDLIVADVAPRYPILLGPKFFVQIGLKHVSSIKISNCTIEYIDPAAFHGLDDLYSVNLTNIGLSVINPDTFAKNKKLRMLTISGNDLNAMTSVHYLLKSSSIEELDLSRNNLMDLKPNAFSKLTNIVYINLQQNNIQKIPEKVFDTLKHLEELDLSYNGIKSLPPTIFNSTSLLILHLESNAITNDLSFGTDKLQQLDLSFNNINNVNQGMFDKMVSLTNLNLKGNGISKIQSDAFYALTNLRSIDLSINELEEISRMIFFKNSELDNIRLNDNPQLSQLPTDGFMNTNGYFTVYFLDISNCAITAMGHKTFSTMPHLTTLKLAWNNINNLEADTFKSLSKLIDLDLSNNLIKRLDNLTFMNNKDLTKLNLAGNPLAKLSVRLFLPMNQLRELDVSECELLSLLSDTSFGREYKFFETLRSFNASANQIKHISTGDVKKFKNLRTLDVSRNPLKCNDKFLEFVKYVSLNTSMVTKKMPILANIGTATTFAQFEPHSGWSQLAHEVCIHHDSVDIKTIEDGEVIDEKLRPIEDVEKDLDEDEKKLLNIVEKNKIKKILHDASETKIIDDDKEENESKPETDADDVITGDYDDGDKDEDENAEDEVEDEDDDDESGEDDDDDDDDDNDDDDDEDDDKDENDDDINNDEKLIANFDDIEKKIKSNKDHKNNVVKVEEVDFRDIDKLFNSNESDDDEEIFIEHARIYSSGYRLLIPITIVVISVLLILLVIAKIVSVIVHKRGERYRMALLASSSNSIVYQKLTEDIKPKVKEPKQPKVHRYAPIQPV